MEVIEKAVNIDHVHNSHISRRHVLAPWSRLITGLAVSSEIVQDRISILIKSFVSHCARKMVEQPFFCVQSEMDYFVPLFTNHSEAVKEHLSRRQLLRHLDANLYFPLIRFRRH